MTSGASRGKDSAASLALNDFYQVDVLGVSQVDLLGVRYTTVNFRVEKSPGTQNQ